MKTVYFNSVVLMATMATMTLTGLTGCATSQPQQISYDNNGVQEMATLMPTKTKITTQGTRIVAVYKLGAFKPKRGEYGFKNYDGKKTRLFLAGITRRHNEMDVIEVDGLKWQREHNYWTPFPNPPIPALEKDEDRGKHFKEYAKWINDHPHFGYPPLPMTDVD